MTTRAIHLEVAPSLETDDFINVLRQFIARRETPKEIRTDCGTNFRGADKELKSATKAWSEDRLEDQLSQRGIDWIFHPPNAPHFSGIWERLIGETKRALKAILKGALVTEHVLRTVFCEVESILNSRPLTRSSEDAADANAIIRLPIFCCRDQQLLFPLEILTKTLLLVEESGSKFKFFQTTSGLDTRIPDYFAFTSEMVKASTRCSCRRFGPGT